MSRKFFSVPQLWTMHITRIMGLNMIINKIILFAVTRVILVMTNREFGGGYGGAGDSVPLSSSPGIRLLARQEDCIGEPGVVASHLPFWSQGNHSGWDFPFHIFKRLGNHTFDKCFKCYC